MSSASPLPLEPPATSALAARLTPSMLFYAFADAVAPAAGRLDKAKSVPCAGPDVKVQQDALAAILVHAALWDLQRRGVIRLEEVERKVLFKTLRSLKVRGESTDVDAEVVDSLEHRLMRAAVELKGDGDVRGVVRRLFPGDVEDPFRRAIAMSNAAEIAAGLVRLDVGQPHGLGKLRGRQETLVWLCDAVASHTAEFNEAVRAWVADRDADRPAFDRLRKEIQQAIESRKDDGESLLEAMSDD